MSGDIFAPCIRQNACSPAILATERGVESEAGSSPWCQVAVHSPVYPICKSGRLSKRMARSRSFKLGRPSVKSPARSSAETATNVFDPCKPGLPRRKSSVVRLAGKFRSHTCPATARRKPETTTWVPLEPSQPLQARRDARLQREGTAAYSLPRPRKIRCRLMAINNGTAQHHVVVWTIRRVARRPGRLRPHQAAPRTQGTATLVLAANGCRLCAHRRPRACRQLSQNSTETS